MPKQPPQKSEMTGAEFDLMKILWRLQKATVAEVRAEADGSPAYTTVMTLLGRLEKKGAVAVDKSRQPYVYRPRLRRESVVRRRLAAFIDQIFDGEAESLVVQLIEDKSLSLAELRELESRLSGDDDE